MAAFRCAHAAGEVGTEWYLIAGKCLAQLGETKASLAFLYVSEPLARMFGDVAAFLRQRTGIPHWVGALGPGVCATGAEYVGKSAIAVLACDLPEDAFRVLPAGTGAAVVDRAGLGPWLAAHAPALGVVHADPTTNAPQDLVSALAQATGGFLVGGLTTATRGPVHFADAPASGGASGVLLGADVAVATGLTQGCSPIGPVRTITAMDGQVVAALDGRRAVDVFRADVGELLARDPARAAGYIHAALPVAGSDTGDYLVRNLVGIDENEGWLAIAAPLAVGDRVMLVRRDPAAALADLERMLTDLRRRVGGVPKAGLYHSCVARGPNQFGPDAVELGMIRDVLGDFPLVGFFGNGEISRDRLYTYTGVLTLFV
ncbi:MAG: FIST N-terminal domain-containing protein [Alphaproteobacteria bacterium]